MQVPGVVPELDPELELEEPELDPDELELELEEPELDPDELELDEPELDPDELELERPPELELEPELDAEAPELELDELELERPPEPELEPDEPALGDPPEPELEPEPVPMGPDVAPDDPWPELPAPASAPGHAGMSPDDDEQAANRAMTAGRAGPERALMANLFVRGAGVQGCSEGKGWSPAITVGRYLSAGT